MTVPLPSLKEVDRDHGHTLFVHASLTLLQTSEPPLTPILRVRQHFMSRRCANTRVVR